MAIDGAPLIAAYLYDLWQQHNSSISWELIVFLLVVVAPYPLHYWPGQIETSPEELVVPADDTYAWLFVFSPCRSR